MSGEGDPMTDRELAGCALSCPCTPDDPMAVFVSRCIEPMQMRGELYVVVCRWCGDNAPFVFVGHGASELNRDAIAAWNHRTPSSEGDARDAADAQAWRQLCEAVGAEQVVALSEKFGDALDLVKDAERYRWFVSNCVRAASLDMGGNHRYGVTGAFAKVRGPTLDAAIDAARRNG